MPAKKTTRTNGEASLKDILKINANRWLSEDEKEEMSDDKTPFMVTSVESTKDKKYGQRWELTVDIDGDERGLTIPAHKTRDESISALSDYVKKNGSAGPMRLKVKPFGEGRTWLSLHVVKAK